ncbi:hypothetical protein TEA_009269 [Camellia sinensis var. sinensis]|uniref:Uncharacterized protein n=1 Tax=Camellia sinensis var. sinensis TaxID=542762 RepID=A0A4S4DYI5_CAMSN|nr:hypothetical protein TEA_009269 [Camellia sinensis var. sinensis]
MKHRYSKNSVVQVPATYWVLVCVPSTPNTCRVRHEYGMGTPWVRQGYNIDLAVVVVVDFDDDEMMIMMMLMMMMIGSPSGIGVGNGEIFTIEDRGRGVLLQTELDIVSDAAEAQKEEDVESQNLASKESECFNPELNDGQDIYLELATKELSDEKAPCDDAETDLEAHGVQDLESSLIGEDKVLGDDAKVECDYPEQSIVSKQLENEEPDQLDIESSNEDELDSDKSSIIVSAVLVAIDAQINFDHPEHSTDSKQLENEHHPTPETVDCGEEPDQLFIEPSKEDESDSEESDSEKSATIESAVQVAIDPSVEENMMFSANPISSHPVISENNTIEQLAGQESIDFVNLVASADPSTLSCPTSLTPMKKSSTKTPTTNRKINSLLDDDKDKENIDKSGNKLDLTKEKPKKDKKELINEKSRKGKTSFADTVRESFGSN